MHFLKGEKNERIVSNCDLLFYMYLLSSKDPCPGAGHVGWPMERNHIALLSTSLLLWAWVLGTVVWWEALACSRAAVPCAWARLSVAETLGLGRLEFLENFMQVEVIDAAFTAQDTTHTHSSASSNLLCVA